jgi:predicted MFS family arabinose efflux permease
MGCIGTWFRLLGVYQQHFEFLITGQIIAAFGQAFMDSSSTKLAANWFGEHERGTAVGVLICGITIATSGTLYVIPRVITPSHFTMFMLVEAVFATLVLALTLIFFRSEPPTPPSTSFSQKPHADFFYSITRIWLNSGFVLLWAGFGLIMGIYELLITVLNIMVNSEGKK